MTTQVLLNRDEVREELRSCLGDFINQIRQLPAQPEKQDRIDFQEALKHFQERGIILSESKLRKLCMTKSVPHLGRFGRRIVFSRKQLDEWIETMTVKPTYPEVEMTGRLQKAAR